MKKIHHFVVSSVVFFGQFKTAVAQDFQNLGFESSPIYAGTGSTYAGPQNLWQIPSWTVYQTDVPQSGVYSNFQVLDETASVILIKPNPITAYTIIDGNQSLFFDVTSTVFGVGNPQNLQSESISQAGMVPGSANSIQFKFSLWGATGNVNGNLPQNYLFLTMNGQNIPLQIISQSGSLFELAGNISNWAGQTAQLSIGASVIGTTPTDEIGGSIDSIVFSPTSVPEPSTFALFTIAGIGGLMIHFREHLKRKSQSSIVLVRRR